MRALAQQVSQAGIRRVEGDIIGDDGAFEPKPVPDGWLQRYLHASYAAPVSALSLNENIVHVVVTPGKAGGASSVRLEPATLALEVTNAARTRSGSRNASLSVSGADGGRIRVSGWIGATSQPRVYVVVVPDPANFATGAFARALSDAGVTISGRARLGGTPATAVPVTALWSPPLSQLAEVMNGESINHMAELIFRNVAREVNPEGVGSAAMGNAVLRDFLLLRVGAAPQEVFAADGSGLSTLDRVTARSLVQLLAYAHRAPWSQEFHSSLPIAGREETLRLRMRATPAQGNLHAKTGTTAEVVALSGYVSSRSGEMLAFAFLYNGRDRWNARATIDAMGATLASFQRE
jgi:D-alanyl-D-alanine carboxypeptidase/D-alanyl-D-alanine-endopeptidase (penicillin-binding protein 4)